MNLREFDNATTVGALAYRLSRAMTGDLQARFDAAGLGVSVEQWRILVELRRNDGLTQAELGRRLGQEKTGVSRLVAHLERKRLVTRLPDLRDGRVRMVWLTAPGRDVLAGSLHLASLTLDRAQTGIGEAELVACKDTLARILANFSTD